MAGAASARLSALSLSPERYAAYAAYAAEHRVPSTHKASRIDKIDIISSGNIPAAFVRGYLQVDKGRAYDARELNQHTARLQATGFFESLSHDFVEEDGVNHLRVNAIVKRWAPTSCCSA
ncbi:hypothetical protein BRCH_01676c [Candidatus Burkholderia brachyanthoides]|nr:hypothetical protein BRCH_01676c [Candidatus Burkholderia brachyanthoides]